MTDRIHKDSPAAAVMAHITAAGCNYVPVKVALADGLYHVSLDLWDPVTHQKGKLRVRGYDPGRACLKATALFDQWLQDVRGGE